MYDDDVVLVTGAGQGIGESIARRVAGTGGTVAVADMNIDAATKVVADIVRQGGSASAHSVDVSERDSVFACVDEVVNQHGRMNALVANAGIIQIKPFDEITGDDWQRMMRVNAEGVLWSLQAAAQHMRAQGTGGKIACASSTAGRSGSELALHYSASKAAVIAMVQAAARALVSDGITVNAYCPGLVDTEMQHTIDIEMSELHGTERGSYLSAMSEKVGLGRFLNPEEIADVAAFLISPAASGITGQTVTIDGGRMFQ